MIHIFLHNVAGRSLFLSHKVTESVLHGTNLLVKGTLVGTGTGLSLLSNAFFYKPEWRAALEEAGIKVNDSSLHTSDAFQKAIHNTNLAFEKAQFSVKAFTKETDDFIFDNRLVSSILGSSHDQKFKLTKIKMSFRDIGKDITPEEALGGFQNSGKKKAILFMPGLLTDETVWLEGKVPYKKRMIKTKGLSTELQKLDYYPLYVRYNHGLPIHENGRAFALFFEEFHKASPDLELNYLAYSLGCLVFRSALYYGKEQNLGWVKKVKKVVFISSPNRGSYLEKIGFWLGNILEKSPNLALKILGMLGNLRSDAIKDLSFGLIRKEPKDFWSPITRYFKDTYHNELDDVDVYEAYSLIDGIQNPIQNFLGDGIVEKQSLRYLTEKVFLKKENSGLRTLEIIKANHFSILQKKELFLWVNRIYDDNTST
jgi:hypothetical protein